jgi:aminoglycoside phosphotransferase (APT) family kinase protein
MMPMPAYMWSDDALVAAARLVRRYHDAVASFAPPEDAHWRLQEGAPDGGEIICHNDLAPWNTVYRSGDPLGLIDWDFAAPGSRLWDVAYAVWRFVPYYRDWKCRIVGLEEPPDYARRTRLFCDAYGINDRSALLNTVRRRQQWLSDTIRALGGASEPGFAELLRMGYDKLPLQDMRLLEERWDEIAAAL